MKSGTNASTSEPGTHWSDMTARWRHVSPPLKPGPEDISVFEQFALSAARKGKSNLEALLLGVTPEIAGLSWPHQTQLTALDSSPSMIKALWPAPGAPAKSRALCADWRAMPLVSGSVDFVAGDGCNALLSFPLELDAMAQEVARVLRSDGIFVLRAFVRHETAETIENVVHDLEFGRIGSVHVLKWRIFAALCEDATAGVWLGEVWNAWDKMRDLTVPYRNKPGWTPSELTTIEVYRGDTATRFYFPTLAQLHSSMSRHFSKRRVVYGGYELADRCPILIQEKSNEF